MRFKIYYNNKIQYFFAAYQMHEKHIFAKQNNTIMKNHLYISDLDKTLLNDNAQLSPYALEELNQMIANGLNFTIATARSQISASHILKGLELKLPVIVANGSFLADFHTGEVLQMQDIHDDLKKGALDIILEEKIQPFVSASDGKNILKLFYQEINNSGLEWYFNDLIATKDPRIHQTDFLHHSLDWHIVSFTVIEKIEKLRPLENKLNEAFPDLLDIHYYENPYHEGWYWMSIHDKKATKGNMLQKFIDNSDFTMENTSVFGDNVNDISMFEVAKNGLAVSNAADTLKEKASKIIGSNIDFGVVKYIKGEFIFS